LNFEVFMEIVIICYIQWSGENLTKKNGLKHLGRYTIWGFGWSVIYLDSICSDFRRVLLWLYIPIVSLQLIDNLDQIKGRRRWRPGISWFSFRLGVEPRRLLKVKPRYLTLDTVGIMLLIIFAGGHILGVKKKL